MADSSQGSDQSRLPIKLIMPKQGTERKVIGGGGAKKPFRDVTRAYRNGLLNQVNAVEQALSGPLKSLSVAPVRVTVIAKASAKSHRPDNLFSDKTCPIIGAGALGELFVKATPDGLTALKSIIDGNQTEAIVKALSGIETIEAVTPKYRRRGHSAKDILRTSPRREDGFMVKVRLFEFDDDDQFSLVNHFKRFCQKRELPWHQRGYGPRSHVYSVVCRTESDVDSLSKVVGVRTISRMPRMRSVRPKSISQHLVSAMPVRDHNDKDHPVVVVVDSGITQALPSLDSWVMGRTEDVAPEYANRDHGSFVAGLICWGQSLNPDLPGINGEPCAVYDLQVLPNDDPDKGQTDELLESEFLESLENALKQHANDYKVWNLSLGTDEVCSLDMFSELAEQLDNLQERYAVSFVVAAGNYETRPLLSYPRKGDQIEKGRITAPADSVLAISVGSISQTDLTTGDAPAQHHPSAFSRHGPGPNHIIKPDLVHYGGTASHDGKTIKGVRSIVEDGSLVEEIGTSFAGPFVSRSLAQIYHQITPVPNPVLARALLTHHSRDPRTGTRVPDGEENYFGFGRPEPVPYCLECSPYNATLIFDDVLRPGYFLEWDDFPYPQSLKRDGRYYGEVWMTLAFAPTRGARWGTEYCESHINANLGVYRDQVSRSTGEVKQVFKGLVPPEHRNAGELYETYQVEQLRKWAPVRTYHGVMGENGQRGNRWRLKLQLLTRHQSADSDSLVKPQPFSLIITIADPERKVDVYDEMSRIVRNKYRAENLAVRTQARIQPKT